MGGGGKAERDRLIMRLFLGYFMPVIALCFLAISAYDLGPALRAKRGEGAVGTLLITERDCPQPRRNCGYFGDFRSDDASVVRGDVRMHGRVDQSRRPGDALRAIDTGDRTGVFPASGSTSWQIDLGFVVVSSAFLLGWLSWCLKLPRLFRRLFRSRVRTLP